MAGFKSLLAKLGFTNAEESEEETLRDNEVDDEEEEDEEEEEGGVSFFSWFTSLFGRHDQDDEQDEEEADDAEYDESEKQSPRSTKSGRVIDYKRSKEKNEERRYPPAGESRDVMHNECIFVVRSLGDSRSIIMHLHAGDSIILNLENIDPKDCGRVIDLLSGAAFALGGSITKVSRLTYLLAPNSINVVPPQNQAATRFTL